VLRTASVGDTKKLYVRIAKHIKGLFAQLKPGHSNKAGVGALPTFAEFIAKATVDKKTTVRDAWTCMLCSAPGAHPLRPSTVLLQQCSTHVAVFRFLQVRVVAESTSISASRHGVAQQRVLRWMHHSMPLCLDPSVQGTTLTARSSQFQTETCIQVLGGTAEAARAYRRLCVFLPGGLPTRRVQLINEDRLHQTAS
jgi:hypothetical protein